jgi:hypothetical protein
MRSIGTFRASAHTTFASETSAHDSMFSLNRLFARQVTYVAPKTGNLDSSQLTRLRSAPKTVDRTNFSPATPHDVKRALYRVRSSGTVAPKKKSAIKRS